MAILIEKAPNQNCQANGLSLARKLIYLSVVLFFITIFYYLYFTQTAVTLEDGLYLNFIKKTLLQLQGGWLTLIVTIVIYLAASGMMIPNMLVNSVTVLTIGGMAGMTCALIGSLVAATLFYFIGKYLGVQKIENIKNLKFKKIIRSFRKKGIFSVIVLRMTPIAPYGLVNMAVGAMKINFFHFIMGTFIAHLPGVITLALLSKKLITI